MSHQRFRDGQHGVAINGIDSWWQKGEIDKSDAHYQSDPAHFSILYRCCQMLRFLFGCVRMRDLCRDGVPPFLNLSGMYVLNFLLGCQLA